MGESLVPVEERLGLGEASDPDQSLDLEGHEAQVTGFADSGGPATLDDRAQLVVGLNWIAERELEQAKGPGGRPLGEDGTRRCAEPARLRSVATNGWRVAEVRLDEGAIGEDVRLACAPARLEREFV